MFTIIKSWSNRDSHYLDAFIAVVTDNDGNTYNTMNLGEGKTVMTDNNGNAYRTWT